MRLLPSQLNELYDEIIETDYFSPGQFTESLTGHDFKMPGTGYYFRISEDTEYANSLYVKFYTGEILYRQASSRLPWVEVPVYFSKWLKYLKREVPTTDKWDRLFDEMRYLVAAMPGQSTNFSYEEFQCVSRKIEHIKPSLAQIPLLEEQVTALRIQLDHLLELTKELNKFDWQSLFIGTMLSIIMQLNITLEECSFAL